MDNRRAPWVRMDNLRVQVGCIPARNRRSSTLDHRGRISSSSTSNSRWGVGGEVIEGRMSTVGLGGMVSPLGVSLDWVTYDDYELLHLDVDFDFKCIAWGDGTGIYMGVFCC